ncbi:MAG: hypothetical protein FWD03_02575 [Defluviitaleaceae bacterium]|nr:hypothetical protein [Defluviitaleaceae bacterium]
MRNGLKLAALYAAVILGAGFASGQELLQYFVGYGTSGIWGLIVAGIVFAMVGWAILDICHRKGINNYKQLMAYLVGKRIGLGLEWLAAAFLFVLLTAMLAAGGAMLEQSVNFPFGAGVLALAVLVLAILWFDLEGIVWINGILTPLMIAGGIFIGLYTFFNHSVGTFYQNSVAPFWILSAVVYASYNIVPALSVLSSAGKLAASRKDCMIGGLLGGAVLTLLGISMALPLYLYFADIIAVEIPFLVIVVGYGHIFTLLYVALMLCAIVTTAVVNAYALVEWSRGYIKLPRRTQSVILVALGIPAAFMGFSNIVGYIYPLFGLLGIFLIVVVLLSWRRKS